MRGRWVLPAATLMLAAMLAAPGTAAANADTGPDAGGLGSLNYLEGQASIGTQTLNPKSVGSAVLKANQTLDTQNGRAEVLLTPGVFLRLDQNSSVRMVSPDLANTEVRLDHGRAMVEGDDIRKENNIRVDMDGASAQLMKNGLYSFDADHNQIFVFKGKAQVSVNNKRYDLGDHRELTLAGKPKAQNFDAKNYEDDFYRWSSLRSAYLAEANVDAAHSYIETNDGWYGTGWYWDPWFGAYTFLPGAGLYYSPFGWGFYSPIFLYQNPFFYRGPFFHHFGPGYIYPYAYRPALPGPRPGFGGGFRGGFQNSFRGGFRGGGFRGGGFRGGHGR